MLRRRPFRHRPLIRRRPSLSPPPPGSPRPRPPLPPKVRRALARANRLMAEGQFAEAANIFGQLADKAEELERPIRAADLMIQAARAHLAADDAEAAVRRAKQALLFFVRSRRVGRVPHLLAHTTEALRNKGYHAEADGLEHAVEEGLGQMGLSLEGVTQRVTAEEPKQRGTLPAQCAGCGAPLVPDEVEWHDAHTAECPYCGTMVKAA